jgi:hypothetical protein
VPDVVGAAFIFAGRRKADEAGAIRRTAMGRDSFGQPYPIPPSIYETIRNEPVRPLLVTVPRR